MDLDKKSMGNELPPEAFEPTEEPGKPEQTDNSGGDDLELDQEPQPGSVTS